jgi:putative cardiolipin synthase
MRFLRFWCALGAVALLTACASLPSITLAPEAASPPAAHGSLSRYEADLVGGLTDGFSAHWLLDRNELAFNARLALTDTAVETLDIQYFIWQEDATGYLLAGRLLAAADRGVKVRLLLDDFSVSSRNNELLRLDAHPRIEVRLFNPWASRRSRAAKLFEFLARAPTLNRRMHNKTYIADGHFAIVGGRNIGDRYFGLYAPFVQNDLDVLLAGPVVRDVIGTFDEFWNDRRTYPAASLPNARDAATAIATTRGDIAAAVAASGHLLQAFPPAPADWDEYFGSLLAERSAGASELYYDTPNIREPSQVRLYPQFKALAATAERELLISSPYFIPDDEFRELLGELARRGVRVRVVTNSLATNNHVVAHTGYKRWRRDVLASGVELYELRGDADALALYVTPPATSASLGLHTKAMVVDGERTFIGSPNVDPRSMILNTEIGVVTQSAELARRLTALIERDMAPENAWRVTMDGDGWLAWSSGSEELNRQPAKGFTQRAIEFLLNLLPLKKQG